MTHQSRMLLIISVFAVGGVSILMYIANRYATVLENQSTGGSPASASAPVRQPRYMKDATARALASVDQFIGVRSRIRLEIDRRGGTLPGRGEFQTVRKEALAESGMKLDDYGRVRDLYRSWREGQLDARSLMGTAFEQRDAALRRLNLGEYEALDVVPGTAGGTG